MLNLATGSAFGQLAVRQESEGNNVQSVTIRGATIVNTARGGEASISIASNRGSEPVKNSRVEVIIEGSIINEADGARRTSRVNIGVNGQTKEP